MAGMEYCSSNLPMLSFPKDMWVVLAHTLVDSLDK